MSGMPSSATSNPAFRSAPEENARPAPVISTARTESDAASPSSIAVSSRPNSGVQAFSESGRFSVSRPTAPDCSQMMVS